MIDARKTFKYLFKTYSSDTLPRAVKTIQYNTIQFKASTCLVLSWCVSLLWASDGPFCRFLLAQSQSITRLREMVWSVMADTFRSVSEVRKWKLSRIYHYLLATAATPGTVALTKAYVNKLTKSCNLMNWRKLLVTLSTYEHIQTRAVHLLSTWHWRQRH